MFNSILNGIYAVVQSYGWTVILFTALIRLVLMPFDYKSRKSMRRMEKINPQLQALQKKYANDKEKLQKKQAELYKKEKINPLGSCLPMLLTLPIMIVMFSAMRGMANEQLAQSLLRLQEAVGESTAEQADAIRASLPALDTLVEPFLWIKNLWVADSPFNSILPNSSSALAGVGAIEGVITQEGIEALRAFIDGEVYQTVILPHYGALPLAGGSINLLLFTLTLFRVPNGFFLLPLLSFATQFFSNALNPQAAQAGQQGGQQGTGAFMKWFFPLFTLYLCASSNAAFALYWTVSNVLHIGQQAAFKRYFTAQERKAAARSEEVDKL